MKIALAQLNPIVGDLQGNLARALKTLEQAHGAGVELVVFSELFVSGYPPKDLLLRQGFVTACDSAIDELAAKTTDQPAILIGHPTARNLPEGRIANAASLLVAGKIQASIQKCLLPNYDVFDERRYFRPARDPQPIAFHGLNLGVHICEDAWWGEAETGYHSDPYTLSNPIEQLAKHKIDLFINLSASPFEIGKAARRRELIARHAIRHQVPFVFVNQVGGNDDLVFDGNSFALDAQGQTVLSMLPFEKDFQILDFANFPLPVQTFEPSREEDILDGLVLGLKDYMRKCRFTDCVLGLSGGIDSALAAYVAAKAVGPQHVHGLLMPSRYSSQHSVEDARQLAENIGIPFDLITIDQVHRAFEKSEVVGTELLDEPSGLPSQNLQARIRGALVMIQSNRHGWMALATGNKSELAVGYCTLYGDMVGGFAVLNDVFKSDVYAVCRFINESREQKPVIPTHILTKPPSAELAPDQFDQDVLPPYHILDAILERLIEEHESVESLIEDFEPQTVRWVARQLDRNEFKRRQMPPGIKLTSRAFGTGRRMPMAARFE